MKLTYLNRDFFEENEKIRAFFCCGHRENKPHSHEFWELSYVYEGQGKHHSNKGDAMIKEGEFLLIKPGAEHSLISPPKDNGSLVRLCNCIFTWDFFKDLLPDYVCISQLCNYALYKMLTSSEPFCIHLSDDNARNVQHLMWLIAHEYNHFTDGSAFLIRNSILELLVIITRLYEYSLKQALPPVSRSAEIDELIKYIRSNFGYKLTLDFLAARIHLSKEYLSRYFKQYTGKNISEFILEVRMSHAKNMLISTSHSIMDISIYCGYSSIGNFQKAFKKYVGISPSAYRKSNI